MKKIYFTIDFEDTVNTESIKVCARALNIFRDYNTQPLIFITGDLIKLLFTKSLVFKEEINIIKKFATLGYHTISHLPPTTVEITDKKDYLEAYNKAYEHETQLISIKNKNYFILDLFYLLFNQRPVFCRFPGFSWTPPYIESLRKLGIYLSFDLYPYNLERIPHTFNKKDIIFIKPDYIVWIDEIIRNNSLTEGKAILDEYLKDYNFINISIHINRLCNKEWWIDYYTNPDKLPLYSGRKIEIHIELLRKLLDYIEGKAQIISQDFLKYLTISTNIKISDKDIRHIYDNAIYWVIQKFDYTPQYLFKHFLNFFHK